MFDTSVLEFSSPSIILTIDLIVTHLQALGAGVQFLNLASPNSPDYCTQPVCFLWNLDSWHGFVVVEVAGVLMIFLDRNIPRSREILGSIKCFFF